MNLFETPSLTFEKVAAETPLSEDPNNWPQEITQELFKQIPYVADFDPHCVMDRVQAEQGYAIGHFEVSNQTSVPADDQPQLTAMGVNMVRVPFVVKNRKLLPLDLMLGPKGDFQPLTEERLRRALFRPNTFDALAVPQNNDQAIFGQMWPPNRQMAGMSGNLNAMVMDASAMGKYASILPMILPTINRSDWEQFTDKVASDRNLHVQYSLNASTHESLARLASYEPQDVSKLAAAALDMVVPSVVQVEHQPGAGYTVKTASHLAWAPEVTTVDRGELVRLVGVKLALEADINGSATVGTTTAVASDDPEADRPEFIKDFGMYEVKTTEGELLVGHCFPNLIDLDGHSLPITLFTNGSQTALQGEIVGVKVSDTPGMNRSGRPRGYGCFWERLPNGRVQALLPMKIEVAVSTGEGGHLQATTFDGRPVQVVVTPTTDKPVLSGRSLLVPARFFWMPLDNTKNVVLASTPEDYTKQASAQRMLSSAIIRSSGPDGFQISGPVVEKLSHSDRDCNARQAMFLLVGAGADPGYARQKLAEAAKGIRPVALSGLRTIETLEGAKLASLRKAAQELHGVPNLRQDLVKEASVIPDPTAVDTVLSLSFINPENTLAFTSYMPSIEFAQKRMCELLMAARLGMRDIPVQALEKAVRSTETVLEGLKVLMLQKTASVKKTDNPFAVAL